MIIVLCTEGLSWVNIWLWSWLWLWIWLLLSLEFFPSKAKQVHIVAVGIGRQYKKFQEQLKEIAGKNVYSANNFDELSDLFNEILAETCSKWTEATPSDQTLRSFLFKPVMLSPYVYSCSLIHPNYKHIPISTLIIQLMNSTDYYLNKQLVQYVSSCLEMRDNLLSKA